MKKVSLDVITVIKNPGSELIMTIDSLIEININSKIELRWIVIDGSKKLDPLLSKLILYSGLKTNYVQEQDNGIYEAMNKGLTCVTSDYFIFINSGDKLLPGIGEAIPRNSGKVICSLAKWHDKSENEIQVKKSQQFRPYFAVMPNHQSMIFPRFYNSLHYEEKWKISSDQSLKLSLWKMDALEFNHEYVSSCLVGGLSMRKLKFREILQRNRESAEVFEIHFGFTHTQILKILYLVRYLLRWDWKRIK